MPGRRRRLPALLAAVVLAVMAPAAQVGVASAAPVGAGDASAGDPAPSMPGGYHALAAKRLLDTRDGTGAAAGRRAAWSTTTLTVTGGHGIPASGVSAVALTLLATGTTGAGYVTAYPHGLGAPNTSSLNWTAGRTVSNLALVKVGTDGKVDLRVAGSATHLVAEVVGYVETPGAAPAAGAVTATSPTRLLDTRKGVGARRAPVRGGAVLPLAVAGRAVVPATGAGTVVLNLTVVGGTSRGYVTASPTDPGSALTSTLNYEAGETVANLVTVGIGPDGGVDLRVTAPGAVDLVADVVGWVAAGEPALPLGAAPVTPTRLLDTRATGGGGPVVGGTRRSVTVAGAAGVPASGVGAALLNVTVADATFSGDVQVVAAGAGLPPASSLAFERGRAKASLVLAPVAADGRVDLAVTRGGSVRLVVDVTGYVLGPPADTTPPAPAADLAAVASGRHAVALSWTPSTDPTTTGVTVRRRAGELAPGGPTEGTLVAELPATATSFTDTGRLPGVTYSYAVLAHDDVPNSARPTTAGATTAAPTWTTATIDPWRGSPQDIACPSASWCMTAEGPGYVRVLKGSTWGAPTRIAPPPAEGYLGNAAAQLNRIDCASTSSCVVAGAAGLFRYTAGTWRTISTDEMTSGDLECPTTTTCFISSSKGFQRLSGSTLTTLAGLPMAQPQSLSCPTTTFCMLVGTTAQAKPRTYRFNGTSWTRVTTTFDGEYQGIAAVSCSSAAFCLASLYGGSGYLVWKGNGWSHRMYPTNLFTADHLDCLSATFCWGVDEEWNHARWNGTTWVSVTLDHPHREVTTHPSRSACGSTTWCVVIDDFGRHARWNGRTRSAPALFTRSSGGIRSLTCASATSCAVGDDAGAVLRFNGTSWGPRTWVSDSHAVLDCPRTTWCLASSSGQYRYRTWNGSSWGEATGRGLDTFDCVDPSWCMEFNMNGQMYRYNGSSWSPTSGLLFGSNRGGSYPTSIECTSRSFCVAVNDALWWSVWNGHGWTTPKGPLMKAEAVFSPDGPELSCAGWTFCHVSVAGRAATWDGHRWTSLGTAPDWGMVVDCTSRTSCLAVGSSEVRAFDGREWLTTTIPPPVDLPLRIDCPATERCVVTGNTQASWSR